MCSALIEYLLCTCDIAPPVAAFEAGLGRLGYQKTTSRRAILTFQIAAQRIADDGIEVDPPAPSAKHGASVQFASGTQVEAARQRISGLRPSASQSSR